MCGVNNKVYTMEKPSENFLSFTYAGTHSLLLCLQLNLDNTKNTFIKTDIKWTDRSLKICEASI